MASLFSLSDTKDPDPHWPRGQNPDGAPLGFEPRIFGMVSALTTAEHWTALITSLISIFSQDRYAVSPYTHIHTHIHTYTQTHTYTHIHTNTNLHGNTHTYIHTHRIHTHIHMHTRAHTVTHTHKHIHTYTHIYIHGHKKE